ncbi:MAG TPA: GerMN domain-containing protein [Candidatus Paceibacterota bacterium]|jgi:spore germination protein GerM|nr:GerMN domain-containing protein [Candidatus Paceibacterota bacterium]
MGKTRRIFIIVGIAIAALICLGAAAYLFLPGLAAHEKPYAGPMKTVAVFYGNSYLDPELDCTKVFPTSRQVPDTNDAMKDAILALIKGPTYDEMQKSFFTSLRSDAKLQNFSVRGGVAYVDFNKRLEGELEGSCQAAGIKAEVTETLKQFLDIKDAVVTVGGKNIDEIK